MTWFEAEQIFGYLSQLEAKLDEWSLNRYEMQLEKAQLARLNRQLSGEMSRDLQPPKKHLLLDLFNRIHQCEFSINERLKF